MKENQNRPRSIYEETIEHLRRKIHYLGRDHLEEVINEAQRTISLQEKIKEENNAYDDPEFLKQHKNCLVVGVKTSSIKEMFVENNTAGGVLSHIEAFYYCRSHKIKSGFIYLGPFTLTNFIDIEKYNRLIESE